METNKTDMDITEDFHLGQWLRKEMEKRHWDIYDLAIESGVSEQGLAEYLRNTRVPKIDTLLAICKAFGKRLAITIYDE